MPLHVKGCESRSYRLLSTARTYPGRKESGSVGPDQSLRYLQVHHMPSESHPPLPERDLCRPGSINRNWHPLAGNAMDPNPKRAG